MGKKLLLCVLAVLIIAGSAFAGGHRQAEGQLIGIAMPTRSSQRWIQDGDNLREQLQALGFRVDLQYGEDIVENQVAQIENMITRGVDALIIAAIDGEALTSVLARANAANIPVIAYDRLIRNSPYVNYYVSFDNFVVGQQMGEILVRGLNLNAATAANPRYIELFGGSPDDNNAYFFYDGAMDILQPFIDRGVLRIGSGQMGMERVGTLRWAGEVAQARMDNLLSAFYTTRRIDGVLSPYDGLSMGIISSLRGAGYGTAANPMPIVGGQDAELPSVRAMIAGYQYATIFKDTRLLAAAAVEMVTAVLGGRPARVNNTTDYHNGIIVVPSYLLASTPVFRENIRQVLVDSGYYTAAELGL